MTPPLPDPIYSCLLCPGVAPPRPKEALRDHLLQFHGFTEADYLRAYPSAYMDTSLGGGGIRPDTYSPATAVPTRSSPSTSSSATSDDEIETEKLRLIAFYASKGLDPDDPRLVSACYNLALAPIIQRRISQDVLIPGATTMDISAATDLSRKVRATTKEARDTIAILLRESQRGEETTEALEAFQETIREAEAYLKSNAGEFFFRCSGCSTWVTTDGVPVPYLTYAPDPEVQDRRVAYLGNDEILYLINSGEITLDQAAFILRTSPEGLLLTSERRGEPLDAFIDLDKQARGAILLDEEAKLQRLRDRFRIAREDRNRRPVDPVSAAAEPTETPEA